jgi:DNA-binding response OmpR family regulator
MAAEGDRDAFGGPRILVVDDDAPYRVLLQVYLERNGYRIDVAADGAAGLQTARAALPDLILLDLAMPDTDGWYALAELKADAQLAQVPVVVLTASADESSEWRAKEWGVARYVTKSANLEDLLGVLSEVLA